MGSVCCQLSLSGMRWQVDGIASGRKRPPCFSLFVSGVCFVFCVVCCMLCGARCDGLCGEYQEHSVPCAVCHGMCAMECVPCNVLHVWLFWIAFIHRYVCRPWCGGSCPCRICLQCVRALSAPASPRHVSAAHRAPPVRHAVALHAVPWQGRHTAPHPRACKRHSPRKFLKIFRVSLSSTPLQHRHTPAKTPQPQQAP